MPVPRGVTFAEFHAPRLLRLGQGYQTAVAEQSALAAEMGSLELALRARGYLPPPAPAPAAPPPPRPGGGDAPAGGSLPRPDAGLRLPSLAELGGDPAAADGGLRLPSLAALELAAGAGLSAATPPLPPPPPPVPDSGGVALAEAAAASSAGLALLRRAGSPSPPRFARAAERSRSPSPVAPRRDPGGHGRGLYMLQRALQADAQE
eukprot:TRINITY_DN3408_c2_g1_i1.p1 TRINITY_DN3408_c2_g1~~TRINITY_DN3408_c2_g1_i1.p1  ORF type:complete len:235 (+),score=68.59 TRINITY_DN3408_c2_g1_i1:89-706(+)